MINVKIDGIEELINVLEKAATKIPNVKKQFLAKEAGIIRGRAIKRTPVDTGLLRGSWKQTPPTDNSVTIYNNVHYGIFVEKGHRVKIREKFTGKVVQGRHMLKNAVEETKANFRQDGMAILNSIFGG